MEITRGKGYITHIKLSRGEIQQIRLLHGTRKTLSQWYAETGADVIINGAFFSTNGVPIECYRTGGKTLSTSDWCRYGFGINYDYSVQFGDYSDKYMDFTSAFPALVKDGREWVNIPLSADLHGNHPRSVFSQTAEGIMLTTVDGRQTGKPGMTIPRLAEYMAGQDVIHSANLDGGGSTHMMVHGKTVNSPSENRAVSNVLAVWLKKDDGGNKVSKRICIDAGHNYSKFDTGAEGNGLREQDITFEIARLAGDILRSAGFDVLLTRNNLTDNLGSSLSTSLSTRAKMANDWKADLFLSVHTNAFTNAQANGTECYVYRLGNAAHPIATKINSAIVKKLATTDRGVKARPDLAVLKQTAMAAILIETAFISNPTDAEKLKNRQDDFARAIAEAVCEHYGVNLSEPPKEVALTNKYSYDNTVKNMILDGVTTVENMQYWEKVLDGREPMNREYVRVVLDRYSERVRG